MNILDCNMVSDARTQGALALSSGEAELSAIGQGVSEALFVRSILLESIAKKVNVIAVTDSTAGKSMATRFGTGKKTKYEEMRFPKDLATDAHDTDHVAPVVNAQWPPPPTGNGPRTPPTPSLVRVPIAH